MLLFKDIKTPILDRNKKSPIGAFDSTLLSHLYIPIGRNVLYIY